MCGAYTFKNTNIDGFEMSVGVNKHYSWSNHELGNPCIRFDVLFGILGLYKKSYVHLGHDTALYYWSNHKCMPEVDCQIILETEHAM